MHKKLIPTDGACVRRKGTTLPGRVLASGRSGSRVELNVRWFGHNGSERVNLNEIESGFMIDMDVQDIPRSRIRKPLGEGKVLETRHIGGRDQVLVEFPASGQRFWLPYENLRRIAGARQRFVLGQLGEKGNAERFRLKCLAHAIDLWNENTGALSRLDIDPLPHQIHLVHHILASGNLNWLIADDVGLGKTIEVGMLLAALVHRGLFRRILLVTPAGLVKQWQEELHHKFGMSDFQIYGTDFEINEPRHWKMYDRVIGSIDRFKSDPHLEKLMQAGTWDLIVFDEAHRLTRRQWGMKYESSERFKLAAELRKMTDALLLLSATPHQGIPDKFQALLELLRPELKPELQTLALNPEIIRDMIIRNRKADVTDTEGNFIFQGKLTRAIKVPIDDEARAFDKALQTYLTEGYASSHRRGQQGVPIGFVMTTYRKLAASSIAAITTSLERRALRLRGERAKQFAIIEDDARFSGENEEQYDNSDTRVDEFFEGELLMVDELLKKGRQVATQDRKLESFINELVGSAHQRNPQEKLVVFTEYRATQDYIAAALKRHFGNRAVALINGSMSWAERSKAINKFEDDALFLVSTEAGGEGLNLHQRCHIVVNYDLPWNPMRLVQRIGRLYRYGQKHKVVVFNMHAPQTMDAEIIELMYDRIDQVVADMAAVSEEFQTGLEDEILGELAEMLDIQDILEEAAQIGIERTRERIDEALRRAREAVEMQRELLDYAASFDPEDGRGELAINSRHVRAFVEGMMRQLRIEVVNRTHHGRVLELHLPESLISRIPGVWQRQRITFDRSLATDREDLQMMDLESPLFRYFMEYAKSHQFDGICAGMAGLPAQSVMAGLLRWQNEQGLRMRQEFTALLVDEKGDVTVNPESFSEWLLEAAQDANGAGNKDLGKRLMEAAENAMEKRLAAVSNINLHPENTQLVAASWAVSQKGS